MCEVVDGDGLVAVRAGAAAADAAAEQLAVRAALLVEQALLAGGALVDDVELLVVFVAAAGAGHRLPPRAMTPCPARDWLSRTLSPLVWQRCAWCSSRSTVAVVRVLGMSSSNAAACRLLLIATDRFS